MAPTPAKTTTTRKPRAKKVEEPAVEAPKKETESQKRNRLRNEAERIVINKHKDEFVEVATKLFADNGLTFTRRLSDKEKAAKEVADRLNQFPELAAMFAPAAAVLQAKAEGRDPFAENESDVEWDVAAADGVEFHEGE